MADWKPIPGETPIDDFSGLKVKGIVLRRQLNECEAQNIRRPIMKYLAKKPSRRSAPFDFAWSLKLHNQMFGDVWTWAGQVRTFDTNIGLPWQQVETSLFTLLDDLLFWEKAATFDLDEQAVQLHHRAVLIHPFANGNGRWSRLLANIWLKRHDRPIVAWREDAVGNPTNVRDQYLRAMRRADDGDYDPLRTFHARFRVS